MHPTLFWKTWTPFNQRIFWTCVTFFVISLLYLWISNLRTPSPVFTPEHFQELETIEIPVHAFRLGMTQFSVVGEHYLVFDHVLGSALKPNVEGSYLFLGLFFAGIILLLAMVTTLPRFWFYMGMGLFILLVVSLRLDSLGLFGITNKIPVAVILLLYALAGYYFQFLRRSESLIKRIVVFMTLTLAVGAAIFYGARISEPLYFLAANGLIAGTILTIVLIFTVAHEIIAAFINVVTQGKKPTRSLRHFLIATTIYWINLLLIYADKKHIISWHFFSFSLFLLLTISIVLGLWGFRQREPLYESIMKANPIATLFYLALAGIGFGTIGYLLATANDPAIQLMKDAILYSHLGYGIIFFVYIIANFISLLGANLPVYKVLYKPNTMPYFTFRLAGLIATFAFFAYSNWQVSVNQVYAGYYNAIGDYHLAQDTLVTAESYYKRSVVYANRNYHAHYALAELDASRWEFEKEKEELKTLANSRPLDLAYLNYSRIHEISNAWQASVDVLKMGLYDFPENGLLQNALGLTYAKMLRGDSAVMMMNGARNSAVSRNSAETNLMGLSVRFRQRLPADSLLEALGSGNPGVIANGLALASLQGKTLTINADPGGDTVLTPFTTAALNNYLLNHVTNGDTIFLAKVEGLARRPSNTRFKYILLAAAAHSYYGSGEIMKAFKLMHEAAFLGQQPKFYNILGLWSLEQLAPEIAIHDFDQALLKNYNRAAVNRALALTESNDFNHALPVWDSLMLSPDSTIQKQANEMHLILTASPEDALRLVENQKLEFARLRFSIRQEQEFERFINAISDQGIKARAIVERAAKFDEADAPEMVLSTLSLAKGLQFSDKKIFETGLHLKLRSLARLKQWPLLQKEIQSGVSFDGIYQQDKIYFDALLGEQAGKSDAVTESFKWLGAVNPFFEDAVVEASRFAAENGQDRLKPYTLLVNALDRNPNSVKLLKAYFVQAALLDFDEPAKETLDKLHTLLSPEAFVQFAKEHPEIFDIHQD